MKTLRQLRQAKGEHWEAMKALDARADEEDRDLTVEEQKAWDEHEAALAKIGDVDIEGTEMFRSARREALEAAETRPVAPAGTPGTQLVDASSPEGQKALAMVAFGKYLRGASGSAFTAPELAALQTDVNNLGGFLVPPMEFVENLIQAKDDQVFIRQFGTVTQLTTSDSIGRPSLDADPADADWTSEIATGSEDSSMRFGLRELEPHPLAKRIKISNKQLRLTPNVDQIVLDRLAYKFALPEEKAFLTGNGVGRPLGLFTASNDGIGTARDVVCGSTTAITADPLIDVKYALKGQYWPNARWLIHRDGIKQVRKLKDQNNQYLWAPGLQGGQPDMILDSPFSVSEHVPNTFTTGLYVLLYGDLSYYWIVEALDFQIQRLVELYAETNQTGFIGRAEVDGMPVLAEAFVRGKLA